MEKSKTGFKYALAALFGFFVLRTVSFIQANNRQQLIVYNVPQKQPLILLMEENIYLLAIQICWQMIL